jgi:hypothetical protein
MKFVLLKHNGEDVAVNKDAVVYVAKGRLDTLLYFNVLDKDGKLKSLSVNESYDEVVAMLNA